VTSLYLIGRVIKVLDNKFELEVLISPIHRPTELVHIFINKALRHKISEGSIIAVKAKPRRKFLIYDLTNLDASEIIELSNQPTDKLIEKARTIGQAISQLELKPTPPLI